VIVAPGDSFLLCSDGFWEYVYEPDIVAALASPGCSAASVLARLEVLLLERAPSQHDNYTAVLVRVVDSPARTD
jgi:serine/threonine protein phosphatase PrpC